MRPVSWNPGSASPRSVDAADRVEVIQRGAEIRPAGAQTGSTLRKMFNAEARAAEAIQRNPTKYLHYLLEEAGGELEARDFKISRILNAPPQPYTRERFDHNYQWTLGWGLVETRCTIREHRGQ